MPTTHKVVCRHCYHPAEVHNVNEKGDCGCGCVRLVPIARQCLKPRTRVSQFQISVIGVPASSGRGA